MHEHPVLAHNVATGDLTAHTISDFVSRHRFRKTALYNELYRPAGVDSVMCAALSISQLSRPVIIGVGLHRGGRDYSARDRLTMNLLRPHLTQAYKNVVAMAQLRGALDEHAAGVITLDGKRRIRLIAGRAMAWLSEYCSADGKPAKPIREGSALPGGVGAWVEQQLQRQRSLASGVIERAALTIDSPDSTRRLVIRLLEADGEVILRMQERQAMMSPETLRALDLSRRESDVLSWIVAGKSNPEIAQILGLSARTVEKHCENMYRKLGVETRAAAVRHALDLRPV